MKSAVDQARPLWLGVILPDADRSAALQGHRCRGSITAIWPSRRRPPALVVSGLPEVVSRLCMKLLAKAPEDRYQSAAGLRADLARSWAAYRVLGHIEPFDSVNATSPATCGSPKALRTRSRDRRAPPRLGANSSGGPSEVVFVSGQAGVGKSSRCTSSTGASPSSRYSSFRGIR